MSKKDGAAEMFLRAIDLGRNAGVVFLTMLYVFVKHSDKQKNQGLLKVDRVEGFDSKGGKIGHKMFCPPKVWIIICTFVLIGLFVF